MVEFFTDGDIINQILDDLGRPQATRNVDTTLGTGYPKWWEKKSARAIINDLELISLGFFYVDRAGYDIWEGRNTRQADHPSAEATIDDTMVNLEYELHERDIYNRIVIKSEHLDTTVTATPITVPVLVSTQIKTGFLSKSTFDESYIRMTLNANLPAVSWGEPYFISATKTGGGNEDVSGSLGLSVIYSNSTKMRLQVNYLPFVQIGPTESLETSDTFTIIVGCNFYYQDYSYSEDVETIEEEHIVEDEDSQTNYKIRSKEIDLPFRLDAGQIAEDLANFYLNYYKNPVPTIKATLIGRDAATLTIILEASISTRVTIVNTVLGLSADFYINKEEHTVGPDLLHKVVWTLEKIGDIEGEQHRDVWILDSSALGVNTVLDFGPSTLSELREA